jgi:hypothetical protein
MDWDDRAAHRRPPLNRVAARITVFVCAVAAFAADGSCAPAASPPGTQPPLTYADSSRAGVLEFLTVAMNGGRAYVVIHRYVQDFSYCSGVVHRIDARAGDAEGNVIAMRGRGTVRVAGSRATVDEPGSRGVHHFREVIDPRERARLVRAFYDREARLRRSIHFPIQLATASSHCKK